MSSTRGPRNTDGSPNPGLSARLAQEGSQDKRCQAMTQPGWEGSAGTGRSLQGGASMESSAQLRPPPAGEDGTGWQVDTPIVPGPRPSVPILCLP